jgi:hypothetical protein
MDMNTLGNIISSLAPGQDFCIYGVVNTESDYNTNVVFTIEPLQKPSWTSVQSGKTPEQWLVIRGLRNSKLSSCDWTMLSDVPLAPSVKTEWETYRQALRDITDQSDPFNITWPTPPA